MKAWDMRLWQVHKASFLRVGWCIDFFLKDDFHENMPEWHLLILKVSSFQGFFPPFIGPCHMLSSVMFLRFLPGVKAWHRAAAWH